MHRRLVALSLAALVLAPAAEAASHRFAVSVTNPTFRFLPGGVPAAGYFTVRNHTDVPIVLTGARSPGCGMIMFHKSSMLGGMSRMQDVPSLTIAVHQEARFQPGGLHLMCMNPTAMMATARTVPVTLQFDAGHATTVNFHLTDARGVER